MLGVHPVRAESDTEYDAFPIPRRNVPQEIPHEPVEVNMDVNMCFELTQKNSVVF